MYYYYPRETQVFLDGAHRWSAATPDRRRNCIHQRRHRLLGVLRQGDLDRERPSRSARNVYYAPDWLNTGAEGTYCRGTAKFTLPALGSPTDWGAYVSGEVGHVTGPRHHRPPFFGTRSICPDYTYWNVGFGFTYKVFTLDLRYHDTD